MNLPLPAVSGGSGSIIDPYLVLRPFFEHVLHKFHLTHDFIPVFYGMLLTLIIGTFCYFATRNIKDVPGPMQNLLEMIYLKLESFTVSMMGDAGKDWIFLIGSLFIYILGANLFGLVPQGESPTSNINQTVALALFTFFFIHYAGLKSQGLNYFKHFLGDVWWLAPLMLPIHIVGELARPLSLSMRLFGNIRGEDITLCILFFLAPLFVPLPMALFMAFTSFIQAMVFTMLTMSYISGALPHGEHGEEEH